MLAQWPDWIDPVLFAEKQRELSGALELAKFPRLVEILFEQTGQAVVDLHFAKYDNWAIVEGRVKAILPLQCQVCLSRLDWAVDAHLKLAVVASLDEIAQLPEDCEPWLVEGHRASPRDLVEEELLLAIPVIPQHAEGNCRVTSDLSRNVTQPNAPASHRPFSILANLKKSGEL